MEVSQQASNSLISRVLFKESPAAFSKGPRFPRSLMVATTASDKEGTHWLSVMMVTSTTYLYYKQGLISWPLNRLSSSLASRAATAKPMPEEHPVTSTLRVAMLVDLWPKGSGGLDWSVKQRWEKRNIIKDIIKGIFFSQCKVFVVITLLAYTSSLVGVLFCFLPWIG